ncbi:hypothetical protein ACWER9_23055 [Micromonospora sp. NPDC003944]
MPLGLVPVLPTPRIPTSRRVVPEIHPPPPDHGRPSSTGDDNENPTHHPHHGHTANLTPTHHPSAPTIMELLSPHPACRGNTFMIDSSGGVSGGWGLGSTFLVGTPGWRSRQQKEEVGT